MELGSTTAPLEIASITLFLLPIKFNGLPGEVMIDKGEHYVAYVPVGSPRGEILLDLCAPVQLPVGRYSKLSPPERITYQQVHKGTYRRVGIPPHFTAVVYENGGQHYYLLSAS